MRWEDAWRSSDAEPTAGAAKPAPPALRPPGTLASSGSDESRRSQHMTVIALHLIGRAS